MKPNKTATTRAVVGWAAIPVLSGFRYDSRILCLELAPRLDAIPFARFWSTPTTWGRFELGSACLSLSVVAGSLPLKEVEIGPSLRDSAAS